MRNAKKILERYHNGTATNEERAWIERWWLTYETDKHVDLTEERERELSRSMAQVVDRTLSRRPIWLRWMPYAAVALLCIVAGLFFFTQIEDSSRQQVASDILPGGNRATLTYGDGTIVTLSDQQSGIVVGEKLTYLDGSMVSVPGEAVAELLLATPKGGTYQAVLPDGTHVWLNAASALRYPSTFKDGERIVELVGEAFFEVKHIQGKNGLVPFIVKTAEQRVLVLGTAFNVSAYPDDEQTKTTLQTGVVEVQNLNNNMTRRLTPGEQSRISDVGFNVSQVDVDAEIGWKNGYFNFSRSSIDDVLKQFSRWYDVEFVYTGKRGGIKLSGSIHRNVSADKALSILDYFDLKYQLRKTDGKGVQVLIQDN